MKNLGLAILALAAAALAAHPASADIDVLKKPVEVQAAFPADLDFEVPLNDDWSAVKELRVTITLPEDCPRGTTALCYVKDAQWNWYQHEPEGALRSGRINQIRIDMSAGAENWVPRGHSREWDAYGARVVRGFGIKLFNSDPKGWKGAVRIERIYGLTGAGKPERLAISDLRVCRTGIPACPEGGQTGMSDPPRIPNFGKYELSFDLTRTYDNPFDPDEIDVRATVTSPSGKAYTQFAFQTRDYVRRQSPLGEERMTPVGKAYWKFRFAPNEVGTWKVDLTLWDNATLQDWKKAVADTEALNKLAPPNLRKPVPTREQFIVKVKTLTFESVPSASHGFVHVDAKDPMYFSCQDGTFFYPIGQMLRSPADVRRPFPGWDAPMHEEEGTYAFDRIMGRLSAGGVNFIRVWMSLWWVGLEAPRDYAPGYAGLGRYNMLNAWRLDHIVEEAERLGMYVKINLNNHGQLSRHVDQEFFENSYNTMYGGPLKVPADFWTSKQARKYIERRYRYIVARWAYSANIMAWEMWNEVDLTEGPEEVFDVDIVANWHRDIGRYMKSIDPWKHMITTHFYSDDQSGVVYSLPEIDFTPGDLYKPNIVTSMRNVWLLKKQYGKPAMISEFGQGRSADQIEAQFHGGLWSSTVLPMAGTAMFWWWNYVDVENLYSAYMPVVEFNKGEDRRGKDWQLSSAQVRSASGSLHDELRVLGRQNSTEAHLWVYDSVIFNEDSGERYRRPPTFSGLSLTVPNLAAGKYRVEFWSTTTGKIVDAKTVETQGETLKTPIPDVKADLAVKVKRAP